MRPAIPDAGSSLAGLSWGVLLLVLLAVAAAALVTSMVREVRRARAERLAEQERLAQPACRHYFRAVRTTARGITWRCERCDTVHFVPRSDAS